jgi:chromosome segregation ATPase
VTAVVERLATRRALHEQLAEARVELGSAEADIERLTIQLRHERQLERTIAESIAAGIRAELDSIGGDVALMRADHDHLLAAHRKLIDALNIIERATTDVDDSGVIDDPADRLQQIYEACLATHFTRRAVR